MEKTVKELQAELAVANSRNEVLQDRVDAIDSNKIPTAAGLKKKGKVTYTREERLRSDLVTARQMGKEAMTGLRKDLAKLVKAGIDPLVEMQEGRFPKLRYLIAVESEIRKHVKRGKRKERTKDGTGTRMKKIDGGFRKGIGSEFKKFAKELIGLTGRTNTEWDEEVPVPGQERLDMNG